MSKIGKTAKNRLQAGFTLAEVIVAIAIVSVLLGSLINGYLIAAKRSEWTTLSDAAQKVAAARLEQARAARWDRTLSPPVDELIQENFPVTVQELKSSLRGTNAVRGTNIVTIRWASSDPPVKVVKSECIWRYSNKRVFTNSLVTYRSPDP